MQREVLERRRGGCINGRAIKVHDLSGLEKQLEGEMKVGIHHDLKFRTDLEFVATVATGGRVKFLSAV